MKHFNEVSPIYKINEESKIVDLTVGMFDNLINSSNNQINNNLQQIKYDKNYKLK